jgi:hypothetical protein
MSVVVNPNITPTFTALGPYCVGDAPGALPGTSTNGINGTWSPATISTAIAGTTTYTFTPAGGQCATTILMSVVVNPNITPTFTTLGPYCVGTTPGILPTTSNNGITGTWSPTTISTASVGTTTYTFTPAGGQCAITTTMSVVVSLNVTPTFTALGPYCVGDTPGDLPTTSNNGIIGTWNPATISTTTAGTTIYTFTPTTGGCATTTTMSVVVSPIIIPTFTALGPYCAGVTPEALPTTSDNGITGTWSPVAISTITTGTTTYTFTPTAGQCATIVTMSVVVNPNITPTFTALGPYCVGATPGVLPTTSDNGITGTWIPVAISTAAAGTNPYTFTPTIGGCATTTTMSVVVSSNIIPTFTAFGPYCVGDTPGVLSTTSDNGITGTWSPVSISTTNAGNTTYTFTPTANTCSTIINVVITVNPIPVADAGTDQIICNGQSANLTAFGGGTYLWSNNNATTQNINVSPTTTSSYTVTVSVSGCSATSDVMVTVNNLPPANAGPAQAICYGFTTTLSGSGGNIYSWSPTQFLSNPNVANPIASPTTSTTYTVTVTDLNGCSATNDMILTVYPQMVVSLSPDQTICSGQSDTLDASGGAIYSWSPRTGLSSTSINNPVASPTVTTAYTVTINDGNGCTETEDMTLTVNSIPTSGFTVSSPICIGQTSTITYTGNGSALSTFNWNFDGGNVISGAGAGPYQINWTAPSTYNISLSVSENGCTSTVTSVPQIVGQTTTSISVIDSINCNGMNNGQVTAVPTGASPFQYHWSNTQTTQIASNLSPNIQYTVTVTDSNGCSASQNITLSQPAPLTMNLIYRHVTCFSYNNGFAKAIISGGTPPYSYEWLPYGTAGNIDSVSTLAARTYTCKVFDTHGCNIDTIFTITQPQQLAYTYITDSVKCFSGSDGSIIMTTNGGSSPYAYTWNPGVSTGPSASNISSGIYKITITDHNGCDTVASITIGEPGQLNLITSGNVNICKGQSTTISASASGGTGNYIFTWDNGLGNGNTFIVNPTATTTYTIYVTDGNSCTYKHYLCNAHIHYMVSSYGNR